MSMYDEKERIGIREVMKLVGMSRYRITESMKRGDFPQCWRPSPRGRVWDREEVIAWFETTRSKPKGEVMRELGQVKDELYRTELELRKVKAARDKAANELDVSVRGLAMSETMSADPGRKKSSVMADSTLLSSYDTDHRKEKKKNKAAAAAAAAGDSSVSGDGAEADAGQEDLAGDDAGNSALASVPAGHVTDEQMRQMFEEFERRTGGSRPSIFSYSGSGDDAGVSSDDDDD